MVLVPVPAVRLRVSRLTRMIFLSFFLRYARSRDYPFGAPALFVEATPCSVMSGPLRFLAPCFLALGLFSDL